MMTETQPLTDRIDAALKATEGYSAGPWAYRSREYDDWGTIRSAAGAPVASARHQLSVQELTAHRDAGTDPTEANSRLIAHAPDLRALLTEALAELRAQAEALARAERDLAQERSSHSDTVDRRDRAHDAADRLAYALFGVDEIGEHTSCNCPWANAAARLEEMAASPALGVRQ